MKKEITVALCGNPNSGKTTIFNALTGSRQHVGNYPGVTVEKKEGVCRYKGNDIKFVDLPGTYSLSAYSPEELIARNFIIKEQPDVVVVVLDSTNIERNFYLAVQIMELNVPMVMAFNMSDTAQEKGYIFQVKQIVERFQASVVMTVGSKEKGIDDLRDAIIDASQEIEEKKIHKESINNVISESFLRKISRKIYYGAEIESEIKKLEFIVDVQHVLSKQYDSRWIAIKLLEKDNEIISKVLSPLLYRQIRQSITSLEEKFQESSDILLAGKRYEFIAEVMRDMVFIPEDKTESISEKIDGILTSRLLGIPLFLLLMYAVFQLTFSLGELPMDWIESGFDALGGFVNDLWPEGSDSLLRSLLVDGIIAGVGGVLVFLPNIFLLFLAIALLEDSGYMARAAFIMDRLMNKVGLHGKSFVPMLVGFGCTVPAIMATRTLESSRDRLTTMLVAPLMSCGARLPIYALIIPVFFPQMWRGPVLWGIYIIGIVLAVLSAKLLRTTVFTGEPVPFIMELPPYRMPTIKSVLIHMWERGSVYLKKAGTVILGISILLWAMTTFPRLSEDDLVQFDMQRTAIEASHFSAEAKQQKLAAVDYAEQEFALEKSIAGRVGHGMEFLLRPMGFDWKIGTALLGSFAAKEVFVAQMGIVYATGEADEESATLRARLLGAYTPLVGFCIMLFCLISAPCMATIAVTRRESNSWRWAFFQLGGLTFLAYFVTVLVYQGGRALGL